MKFTAIIFLWAIICLFSTADFAQSPRFSNDLPTDKTSRRLPETSPTPPKTQTADDSDVINIETELVTIPVKVTDRNNRSIAGLKKENFKVFEDGRQQDIALFSTEEQPFTVALVLDMSYSTTFKISEIQQAATAFIDGLRPDDRVMIVSFDEDVHLLCEPTSDRQKLYRAIKKTRVDNGTSLYEAVGLVLNDTLAKVKGRKAIVLFTDGVDTTSSEVNDLSSRDDVRESEALIYPIEYDTYADVQKMVNRKPDPPVILPSPMQTQNTLPFPRPFPNIERSESVGTSVEDYKKADLYLNDLANLTGGRLYHANSTANLERAFSDIAAELREFYSLSYYPQDTSKTGKQRRLKVKVNRDDVSVQARAYTAER